MTTDLILERRGAAGLITLNRPKALNALTHDMVRKLRPALEAWADDPAVARVVIRGEGGKAFCAGGDIRALYDLGRAGRHDEMLTFWREEYELNILIKRFPKPFVALIDGIVMGGGVGLSIHGSHVVAGSNFAFAMPEVGIGFFPDVGGTWFLPRMPGETGTYAALTGARFKQGDALATGLATHAVSSESFAALTEALTGLEPVDAILERFAAPPVPSGVTGHRGSIQRCFAFDTVDQVLAALDHDAKALDSWCAATAATIRTKSPTSLKIAIEQVRRGAALSFEAAMVLEFGIVSRICRGPDFYEGVRAVIVDKDNAPSWAPATLDEVSIDAIAAYFAPLERGSLDTPPVVAEWIQRRGSA